MNSITKPRCKVGDLAFVTAPALQANAGLVVSVIRPATPEDCFNMEPGDVVWWCRSEGRPVIGMTEEGSIDVDHEWAFLDRRLTPIRAKPEKTSRSKKRELVVA
jgi:hypothetical protein